MLRSSIHNNTRMTDIFPGYITITKGGINKKRKTLNNLLKKAIRVARLIIFRNISDVNTYVS